MTSSHALPPDSANLAAQQQQLSERWRTVLDSAGHTIDWLEEVRNNSKRVDNEADSLILALRRSRNIAHSLERVALTPITIGFFGLSQAGKSYLISSLAAGHDGKLETHYGNAKVDFLEHVNPVGGGKEATGLVTRFSRQKQSGEADFPIELRLFQEVEIAKILLNAYFNDFDPERVEYVLDDGKIHAALQRAENARNSAEHAGVSADDVVSLWDYATTSFGKSVKPLEFGYWQRACQLAPCLNTQDRAQLFSLLWGEIPDLTHVYAQLAATLQQLSNATTAYAPLSALIIPSDGGYSQRDSIMNVDMLGRLGSARDVRLQVRPQIGGKGSATLQPPVPVFASHLAALTAELIFPLSSSAQHDSLNQVDLLDFPGYRGREAFTSMADAHKKAGDGHPAAPLILRGKVAYLFERYTDQQEMNILVLCNNSDKQSDVTGVGPVLARWVNRTQGRNPQERSAHACGLIWAMTMFDKRISASLSLTESQLKEGWESLVHITMLERFGSYDWMNEWSRSTPFNNTYLVRKPGFRTSFLDVADGKETQLSVSEAAKLHAMEHSFSASPSVQKHVADPAQAWQAMLALNDGGMARMSHYIQGIATPAYKLEQIQHQLQDVLQGLVAQRIRPLYVESDGDQSAQKKDIANTLWKAFGASYQNIPELLVRLELSSEDLRELYISGQYKEQASKQPETQAAHPAEAEVDPFAVNDNAFNLFDSAPCDTPACAAPATSISASAALTPPALHSDEKRFAHAVFKRWVGQLRELPEQQHWLAMLKIDPGVVQSFVDEIITAASRQGLEEHIEQALAMRSDSGSKREQIAMRQVLKAQTIIRDFIAWIGFDAIPISQRPQTLSSQNKQALFAHQSRMDSKDLPLLGEQPANLSGIFMQSWLSGIYTVVEANAGHNAGSEITPQQNHALGQILANFDRVKE